MSKPTLGRARGLNSIADPSDFKGSKGRPAVDRGRDREESARDDDRGGDGDRSHADTERAGDAPGDESRNGFGRQGHSGADSPTDHSPPSDSAESTSRRGRRSRPEATGGQRTRRELSVPIPVSDAVEATGINPADVVMSAYRRHSDAIYTGSGGRLMSRGRRRLRLSLTDGDYDKITRLGDARGWNRSETVAVLLAMELLDDQAYSMP